MEKVIDPNSCKDQDIRQLYFLKLPVDLLLLNPKALGRCIARVAKLGWDEELDLRGLGCNRELDLFGHSWGSDSANHDIDICER